MSPVPVEIKITIKNSEQKYVKKHLCYEPIQLSPDDQILAQFVQQAIGEMKGVPDEIDVSAKMVWQ